MLGERERRVDGLHLAPAGVDEEVALGEVDEEDEVVAGAVPGVGDPEVGLAQVDLEAEAAEQPGEEAVELVAPTAAALGDDLVVGLLPGKVKERYINGCFETVSEEIYLVMIRRKWLCDVDAYRSRVILLPRLASKFSHGTAFW